MEIIERTQIKEIIFEGDHISILINDQIYKWNLKGVSQKLLNASDKDKYNYIISPSGYGIHWPSLDEDVSISGLLKNYKEGA